jgi:gas vesicle protein
MTIAVDRSVLRKEYREAELEQQLINFADLVSFAKPCCNFVIDDTCVDREWTVDEENKSIAKHLIRKLRVFENGEELGDICVARRYTRGSSEMVYKVRSFRISKERGDRNGVMAKDIKVALRHAKKVLVSRESSELIKQVKDRVQDNVNYLESRLQHQLSWTMDCQNIGIKFALLAHEARQKGEQTINVPVSVVTLAHKQKDHEEACEEYKEVKSLKEAVANSKGYGVFRRIDDSLVVYSFATDTVKRYSSFDELPEHIQSKYAMFKVIEQDDPHATLGCKFNEGYTYVVE